LLAFNAMHWQRRDLMEIIAIKATSDVLF